MLTEAKLCNKRWEKELARRHVSATIARHGPRHFQRRQGKIKAKMVFEKDSITVSPAPQIQPVSATPKQGVFKRMTSWISRKRG